MTKVRRLQRSMQIPGTPQSRTFKASVLASGEFLSACAGLIIFAVLSRILTVHDYATYRQTILAYSFAAPLLMLGLPQALYYFLPGKEENARGILLENVFLLFLMGIVFSLFLLFGGNRLLAWRFSNPDLEKTLLVFAPYPLLTLPVAALSACLMARNRVNQLAIFNVLSRLVVLMAVLGVSLVWQTAVVAIGGTIVAAAVVLYPALSLMLSSTKESKSHMTTKGMWLQIKYSVPFGLATIIGTIALSLDKIIVSSMCSPEKFAIYANGAIEIPLISIITGSVTAVLLPDLNRFFKQRKYAEALSLWKRSSTKVALLLFPSMFLSFFLASDIISVLFSEKFLESYLPFRFYLLLLPIRITNFGAMIMASGKSHLILIRSLFDLTLNLVFSIFLVSLLGYIGAIVGTILTMYLWTIPFNSIVIKNEYRSKISEIYPYAKLTKIFIVSGLVSVVFLPSLFFKSGNSLMRLLVYIPIYSIGVGYLFDRMQLIDMHPLLNVLREFLKHLRS